ncbi:MAG: divalent-cation tolerance protein CutA [Micromonosporaceae bacterium]|nr:divalent-cation tolerance protein CutA [Micromonosporaceae bacterium]
MSDVLYYQVSTTTDTREAASALAESAVQARLAACAQVLGPITSTYWWEGKIEQAEEFLVLLKTTAERAEALQAHLIAEHSYDVPEVIRTPITGGNPAYLSWVEAETQARG